MAGLHKRIINTLFFSVLGVYLGAGVFLNLCYVFSVPGLETFWRPHSYIVNLVIGFFGFLAGAFLLLASSKIERGNVEKTILTLLGLTAIFFGTGGLSMGIIEGLGGGEFLTGSQLTLENIIPPIGFLLSIIAGVTAIVVMTVNSYPILSRTQLLLAILIPIGVFVILGVLSFSRIPAIKLYGFVKIIALFFAAVCLGIVAVTTFIMMAFGRGKGRAYWLNIATGIMLSGLSGLAAIFCYAVGGKWVGLTLLGFTTSMAFLGFAGYKRWQKVK